MSGLGSPGSSGTGHPAATARRNVTLSGDATCDHGHQDPPDMSTTRLNKSE